MTDEERWQWEDRLKPGIGQSEAVEAILDRVEQLERERDGTRHTLAIKMDALRVALAQLDEAREAGRKAYAELAAARADPPKPKRIICPACGKEDFRRYLGTRQCYECGHQWEETP